MLQPLHIALLELKRYLVNGGELAFGIALPIALFALIYGAFGDEESFHATVDVVNLDRGEKSRNLIDRLDALDELTVRERSLEEADDALDRSAILFALVIPEDFTESLGTAARSAPTSLIFKQRGSGGETGQIVAAITRDIFGDMVSEARILSILTQTLEGTGVAADRIDAEVARQLSEARQNPSVALEVSRLGDQESDILDRMIPGVVVMFLMFAVTLGAQSLVGERRIGTLERLMTTRLSINQLFLGKYLAGIARATLQALVLLTLAFVALRVGDVFDFLQLMAFSVLVASAVSAVGLVIGTAVRTRDQAIWVAVFFTMFMTIFGGTFFDVGTGGVLYLISQFTINSHAIDAMHQILSTGEHLGEQGIGIAVLLGVTVVGLAVARLLFRVSEGGR